MSSLRDELRSLTVGLPTRKARKKLVTLRDPSQPKRREPVYDDVGEPVLVHAKDAHGELKHDDAGAPVMEHEHRLVRPPLLLRDGNPAQVEVREPAVKLRSAILRAAGLDPTNPASFDQARYQTECVIALTYEPGTNVQIYADADRQGLLAQLAGGFLDDIYEAASELMSLDVDEKAVEKNSKGTASV